MPVVLLIMIMQASVFANNLGAIQVDSSTATLGMPESISFIGEFFSRLYEGLREIDPNSTQPIMLPASWLLVQILISLSIGESGVCELSQMKYQDTIRAKSRYSLWLSKCCCTAIVVGIVYFAILISSIAFDLLASGDDVSLIGQTRSSSWPSDDSVEGLCYLVSLPMLAFAFALAQSALFLVIGRTPAFLTIVSFYLLSIVIDQPFMIGDGSMLLRSTFAAGLVSPMAAIGSALILSFVAIILGGSLTNRVNQM